LQPSPSNTTKNQTNNRGIGHLSQFTQAQGGARLKKKLCHSSNCFALGT